VALHDFPTTYPAEHKAVLRDLFRKQPLARDRTEHCGS
jgi:hypothetical protein